MGALGLHCIEHLASRRPDQTKEIVLAYQADRATHYPPAITAVNVAQWLLEWLQDATLAESHFEPIAEDCSRLIKLLNTETIRVLAEAPVFQYPAY